MGFKESDTPRKLIEKLEEMNRENYNYQMLYNTYQTLTIVVCWSFDVEQVNNNVYLLSLRYVQIMEAGCCGSGDSCDICQFANILEQLI